MPEATTDPTPTEIEAACQEIRAGWSEAQKLARFVGGDQRWLAPLWAECPDDGEPVGW